MFKKILFLILIVSVFCTFGAGEAKASGNVFGWAWSENIGWISFNNLGTTDHNGDAVPAGGGSVDYGVNIDLATGALSGYAWSENIGWIRFDPEGSYPTTSTVPPHSACVNLPGKEQYCDNDTGNHPDYTVTGWARACSVFDSGCSGTLNANAGGWDGWIELHNISIDTSVSPAEFHYWVWGGSDDILDTENNKAVIGWGTFNCIEGGAAGENICGASNYKVVINLSVKEKPLVTDKTFNADYCSGNITLGWTYVDNNTPSSNETKFQFQIADNSDFTSPKVDVTYCDLNYNSPHTTQQTVHVAISPAAPLLSTHCTDGTPSTVSDLSYNTTYYWRVKVYNSAGLDSDWSEGASFKTPLHHYPIPDFASNWPNNTFTWENKSAPISFADASVCYDIDNLNTPCNKWTWDFGDDTICNDSTCQGDASHTYTTTDNATKTFPVVLTVCDADNFCCSYDENMIVKNPKNIPEYHEISPF